MRREHHLGSASQRITARDIEKPRDGAPTDWSTWTKKTYEVSSTSRGLLQRLPQVHNKKISMHSQRDSLCKLNAQSRFASCDSRLSSADSAIFHSKLPDSSRSQTDRAVDLPPSHKVLIRSESISQLIQSHKRQLTERISKQRTVLIRRQPVRTEPVSRFDSHLPSQRFLPADKTAPRG